MWCKESTCSTTSRIFCSVKLPPNCAGLERAAAGLVRVTGAPACAPPPPHRRRRRSRRSLASPRLPPKPSPPSISSFLGCAERSTASVPATSRLASPSPPFAPSAPGCAAADLPPTFRLRRHLSTVDAPYSPPACDPVFPWDPTNPTTAAPLAPMPSARQVGMAPGGFHERDSLPATTPRWRERGRRVGLCPSRRASRRRRAARSLKCDLPEENEAGSSPLLDGRALTHCLPRKNSRGVCRVRQWRGPGFE